MTSVEGVATQSGDYSDYNHQLQGSCTGIIRTTVTKQGFINYRYAEHLASYRKQVQLGRF